MIKAYQRDRKFIKACIKAPTVYIFTDGVASQYLKHVTVPVIDRKTCYNQYKNKSVPKTIQISTCDKNFKKLIKEETDIEVDI